MADERLPREVRSRAKLAQALLMIQSRKTLSREQVGLLAQHLSVKDMRIATPPKFKHDDNKYAALAEIGDSIRSRERIIRERKIKPRLAQTGMLLLAVGDSNTDSLERYQLLKEPLVQAYVERYRQQVPDLPASVVIDETLVRDLTWYEEMTLFMSDYDS